MNKHIDDPRTEYLKPQLEQHDNYIVLTGLSIPINLSSDPLVEESLNFEGGLK